MPGRFTLGVLNINNIILAQAYTPSNIKLKNTFFWSKHKTLCQRQIWSMYVNMTLYLL